MIDLRRILVPTDFSNSSQNALTYAAAFAEKFGAELHLLHVVQDLTLFIPEAVFVAPPPAPPVEQFVAAARTALDRVVRDLRLPGVAVHPDVAEGIPAEEILRVAQEKDALRVLFVVAGHGGETKAPILEKLFAKVGGLDVKKITALPELAKLKKSDYDVVLFYGGPQKQELQERAIQAYVEEGGGVVALHHATANPSSAWTELVGGRSTGKTSVLLSSLAAATRDGGVAALVDAVDRLDPRSLQHAGGDLSRVLWVRGAAITIEMARPMLIEEAVSRAVRAFDLIIRAGGFSLVALDLSDVPSPYLRALPWATWKRLAFANEGRSTVGLIVNQEPVGRSARGMSITCHSSPVWIGSSDQSRRFGGFEHRTRCSAAC